MATTFPIPKGYQVPEGVKDGKTFQEVATFKLDGKQLTIVDIGQDKNSIKSKDSKSASAKPKGAMQSIKESMSGNLSDEDEDDQDQTS